jgi:hypothetical protein
LNAIGTAEAGASERNVWNQPVTWEKLMKRDETYSREKIIQICEEIGRQWEYHLVTRAVFPVDAVKSRSEYSSPPFYRQHGAAFRVVITNSDSPLIRRALTGVPHWLNQNFIIRLFGLLDEDNVITAGKEAGNKFTDILAGLRHMVGSHSSGYANPQKREFRKVTSLIKAHLVSFIWI